MYDHLNQIFDEARGAITLTQDHNLTRWNMIRKDFEIFSFEKPYKDHTPVHYHDDFYEIFFFQEGSVTYQIDMNQYELVPGDMLLIPPKVLHWPLIHDPQQPYKRMFIWINEAYLRALSTPDCDLTSCFHFDHHSYVLRLDHSRLMSITLQIKQLLSDRKHSFGDELSRRALITLLMLDINRMCMNPQVKRPPSTAPSQRIQTILHYVDEHLSDRELSLETISKSMFLSKSTIAKIFFQQTGVTLHKYITKVKINRAHQLLQQGISAEDVARSVGYGDYSSFYRAFCREYGYKPSMVLGRNKEAENKQETGN